VSQSVSLNIFGKASVPWDFFSVQKILEKIQAKEFVFVSLWEKNDKPESEQNLVSNHCSPEKPLEIIKNSFVPGHYLDVEVISALDELLNEFLKTLSKEVIGEFSFMSTSISFGEHVMESTDMDCEITTRSPSTLSFSIQGGFDTPLWTSEYESPPKKSPIYCTPSLPPSIPNTLSSRPTPGEKSAMVPTIFFRIENTRSQIP